MQISLKEIAEIVSGEVSGDAHFFVQGLKDLREASAVDLSFYVGGVAYLEHLKTTQAGAVILRASDANQVSTHKIVVQDPYLAYAKVSTLFRKPTHQSKPIADSAVIDASVKIGDNVIIGANSVIGSNVTIGDHVVIASNVSIANDVTVGDDCWFDANVVICENTHIGKRCRISAGAIIGSSGFGYAPNAGNWQRIEQLGGVIIGDDVDIGANTTIDCGALSDTQIGNGVKIDNHVQIAHNVKIGDFTIMASFVGIAGSATIGKRCQLGGRSSIMGHINMADDVIVHTNTFVSKSVEKGVYSGMLPAQPAKRWLKTLAHLNKLAK